MLSLLWDSGSIVPALITARNHSTWRFAVLLASKTTSIISLEPGCFRSRWKNLERSQHVLLISRPIWQQLQRYVRKISIAINAPSMSLITCELYQSCQVDHMLTLNMLAYQIMWSHIDNIRTKVYVALWLSGNFAWILRWLMTVIWSWTWRGRDDRRSRW